MVNYNNPATFFGFDEVFNKLQDLATIKQPNYPPYNVKKISDNKYLIELAVAGFAKHQLEVVLEKGVLTVSSRVDSEDESNYLYKGIALRDFTRKFAVADTIEVKNAEYLNGLLRIFLENIIPEDQKPKKIEISTPEEKAPAQYPAVEEK